MIIENVLEILSSIYRIESISEVKQNTTKYKADPLKKYLRDFQSNAIYQKKKKWIAKQNVDMLNHEFT